MSTIRNGVARERVAVGILVAALISGLATPAPASADGADLDATEAVVESATEFWTEYGVPPGVQESLVAKIRSGQAPDSVGATTPATVELHTRDGFEVTESTYPDGSISVTRMELPGAAHPGGISTFAVSGCSVSGNFRSNCIVDRWDGVIQQSFRADFTFVDNGYDRIDAVRSANYTVIGSSSSSQVSFGVVKKYENAAGPARAEFIVQGTFPWGTHTYGLGLRVGASIGGQHYTF